MATRAFCHRLMKVSSFGHVNNAVVINLQNECVVGVNWSLVGIEMKSLPAYVCACVHVCVCVCVDECVCVCVCVCVCDGVE